MKYLLLILATLGLLYSGSPKRWSQSPQSLRAKTSRSAVAPAIETIQGVIGGMDGTPFPPPH